MLYSYFPKTGQALRAEQSKKDQEEKFHQDFQQFLTFIENNPECYTAPRLQYLRDFVSLAERFPQTYVNGDDTMKMPPSMEGMMSTPTKGYVRSLADLDNETETIANPILLVLAVHSYYKKEVSTIPDKPQNIKFTELSLVDGDGEKIHARLNRNLVEIGCCMLKKGDKMRLDLFTPIRFRVNASSPRMPMLFIHKLSRVGSESILDSNIKSRFMSCQRDITPSEPLDSFESEEDYFIINPREHDKPECTNEKRRCALYGIRFLTCVCDAIPVSKLDLDTIKADCYFATDEITNMEPRHIRNMVYWWYATNVYSIVGKHNIQQLPICLEYEIRKNWPNPDGVPYKGNKKLRGAIKRKTNEG